MLLAEAEQKPTLLDFALPLIPWVIVFLFIWFFVFRGLRSQQAKARQDTERAHAHWNAVEAKLDRVIELLEQRTRGE